MLADTAIRNARCREQPYQAWDSQGLYLPVDPGGSELWRGTLSPIASPLAAAKGR